MLQTLILEATNLAASAAKRWANEYENHGKVEPAPEASVRSALESIRRRHLITQLDEEAIAAMTGAYRAEWSRVVEFYSKQGSLFQ